MAYWTSEQLASIHKMLNPQSIAVVGATERMQYGGRFLRADAPTFCEFLAITLLTCRTHVAYHGCRH